MKNSDLPLETLEHVIVSYNQRHPAIFTRRPSWEEGGHLKLVVKSRQSHLAHRKTCIFSGREKPWETKKKKRLPGYPQNCSDDVRWSFSPLKQCSQLQFGGFPLQTTLQLACPATSRPVLHRSPALRTPHRCSSGRSRESPRGTWYSIPAYLHRGEWNPMGVWDNTRVEESKCSVQNIGMGGMGSKS